MSKYTAIRNQCDAMMRQYVYQRDGLQCRRCGMRVNPDLPKTFADSAHDAHLIRKSQSTRLRWDPLNHMLFCYTCHQWYDNNPKEANDWLYLNHRGVWSYLNRESTDLWEITRGFKSQWMKEQRRKLRALLRSGKTSASGAGNSASPTPKATTSAAATPMRSGEPTTGECTNGTSERCDGTRSETL